MGLSIEWIAREDRFTELAAEWDDLVARCGSTAVFLSWPWLSSWWRTFGKGKRLLLLAARDEQDRLIGALPAYVATRLAFRSLPVRVLQLIGDGESPAADHLDVLAVPDRADEIASAIAQWLSRNQGMWDIARLDALLSDSLIVKVVAPRLDNGRFRVIGPVGHSRCPYVPLPANAEGFWSNLSHATRKTLRRYRRKIESDFDAKVMRCERAEDLPRCMETVEQLHVARKRQQGLPGKFASADYRSFHQELAAALLERGQLDLSILWLDGRPAAAHYGLKHRSVLFSYQTGFDPAFASYSPMNVLDTYVIEHAIEQGLSEIDMLRGDQQYKTRWAKGLREQVALLVESRTPRGLLHHGLRRGRAFLHFFSRSGTVVPSPVDDQQTSSE